MKYLKKFENDTQYENYINGSDVILPNVSLCTTEGNVYYNPSTPTPPTPTESRLVCKYITTNLEEEIQLFHFEGGSGSGSGNGDGESNVEFPFTSMEVDGVEMEVATNYRFSATGEHTVKFTLADPTSIGDRAFNNCSGLTSIVIPSGVTSIGEYTFYYCTSLTTINIPNSVTWIGAQAFYSCYGLTSIDLPSGVTSIGQGAFYNCSGLTSIDIPDSVTSIGNNAFYGTPWWSSYSADTSNHYGNIIYINNVAYKAAATSITSCVFKETTVSIGYYAFSGCSDITSVTIPSCVTSIGNGAFYRCYGLTSVTIPDSVTSISDFTFRFCSGLTSVTIGSGVTSIGEYTFYYCSSLTSIVSNATTAPTITSGTFQDVKTGGTLTVPSGSSGYDVWMQNADYYLGLYGWTKVEQ